MVGNTPVELLEALEAVRGRSKPIPESLDRQQTRLIDRVRSLFGDRNLVGIGIAEKITDGRKVGELALCFYVRKKLSISELDAERLLPSLVSVGQRVAVFTDVQEIGDVVPQANMQRSPLLSGFSIGCRNVTGTLSAIVQ